MCSRIWKLRRWGFKFCVSWCDILICTGWVLWMDHHRSSWVEDHTRRTRWIRGETFLQLRKIEGSFFHCGKPAQGEYNKFIFHRSEGWLIYLFDLMQVFLQALKKLKAELEDGHIIIGGGHICHPICFSNVLYQVISARTSHQICRTKYKASTGQKEMYVIFCSSYYVNFLVLFRLKQRFTHSSFTTSKMGNSRTFQLQWYQVGNYSFWQKLLISPIPDRTKHDTLAVHAFKKLMIEELQQRNIPMTHIHYISDGAASQYKNCKESSVSVLN